LVEEGDIVEEGQVLAKLDTSEWEKELRTLESNLLQAVINLQNEENTLELASLNARIALKTAYYNLYQAEEAYKRAGEQAEKTCEEAIAQALTTREGALVQAWKVREETIEQAWKIYIRVTR